MPSISRVYDPPEPNAGTRILVDRLWPRGLAKEAAHVDEWVRDVAPSTELRRWFGHDPDRYPEFVRRYRAELAEPPAKEALAHLRELTASGRVTLLTATRDPTHSHAQVLADLL